MSDTQLRRLFSRLSTEPPRRRPSCPDVDRLVAYVGQRLGEAERQELESHLGDCAFCLGQVRFALRSAELGPPPAVPPRLLAAVRSPAASRGRRLRRPALGWLAAAAGVMFAVVALRLSVVELPLGDGAPGAPAGRPPGQEVRALSDGLSGPTVPEVVQPRAGRSVRRAALSVAWRAVPEALDYTVQVMDARGDLLWQDRTEALSTTVPGEVELAPGGEYFVWVTAQLRSGLEVKSPAAAFRIASE